MHTSKTPRLTGILAPVLGEFTWHSVTRDPEIRPVSEAHASEIERLIAAHLPPRGLDLLEVGAYAHYSGDILASRYGHRATLLDIAASTLRLGREGAVAAGIDAPGVRRVAADFHRLPFEDGAFDLVFMASALHHTLRWQEVFDEMVRVTAGGGLIVLLNEPCLRQCCAYKFRTHRPGGGPPLEQFLDRAGLLRLVAEPYLGSLPETLFGMVENQRIPLRELLARAEAAGSLLEMQLDTAACMGPIEYGMVADRPLGAAALTETCVARVQALLEEARAYESDATRGMGFALPEADEVRGLITSAATRLCAPESRHSPEAERLALAETFGAAVKLIVRRSPSAPVGTSRLVADAVRVDGVDLAYPARMRELLLEGALPTADIQASDAVQAARTFPSSEWVHSRSADGIASVVLTGSEGTIRLAHEAADGHEVLLLLRAHVGVGTRPLQVSLGAATDDDGADTFDAFMSEAVLLRAVIPAGADAVLRVRPLVAADGPPDGGIALSYAAALRVPRGWFRDQLQS